MKACIVAIAKDEASYLYEWAAYHLALGFDKIFLYDNDSSDSPGSVLSALADRIEIIKWPTVEGISPQLSAYNYPATDIKSEYEFAAFIDIDEFITLRDQTSIKAYLSSVPGSVSAIALNQKIFGSSHIEKFDNLPVTYRFQRCAESSHPEHLWFKTIYRTKSIRQINSCHKGDLLNGCYADASFNPDNISDEFPGQTKVNASEVIHLNHYILKSKEEFETKKKVRGGGMETSKNGRLERYDNDYFFNYRDGYANNSSDSRIVELISQLTEITKVHIYPLEI